MEKFEIGDQIKYNPGHEEGIEYGFVSGVSPKNGFVICRFWSKHNPGCLRTMANSEICYPSTLEKTGENIPQRIIDAWLKYLEEEKK